MRIACLAIVAVLFCFPAFVLGQQAEECERILLEYFESDTEATLVRKIYLLRHIPLKSCESLLLNAINDKSIEVVAAASSLLNDKSKQPRHRKAILSAIEKLKPETSVDRVRVANIKVKLGDAASIEELRAWASLDLGSLLKRDPKDDMHECPMQCVQPSNKAGRCAVCGMELLVQQVKIPGDKYDAQLYAIRFLHELKVKNYHLLAKRIVTSDAPAFNRLEAADYWGQVEPKKAYPHLALFLDQSHNRLHTVHFLAEVEPERSINVFDSLLKQNNLNDPSERYELFRALIKSGRKDLLQGVRTDVEDLKSVTKNEMKTYNDISLLAEFGNTEDIPRLASYLDSEFRIHVAQSILRIRARIASTN